jgi:hypothetical protein
LCIHTHTYVQTVSCIHPQNHTHIHLQHCKHTRIQPCNNTQTHQHKNYAGCHHTEYHYTDCHHAEYHYAEYCQNECHYGECCHTDIMLRVTTYLSLSHWCIIQKFNLQTNFFLNRTPNKLMSANFHPLTSTPLQIHFDIYIYIENTQLNLMYLLLMKKNYLCLLTKSLSPPMSFYNA